jgi:hypothetical protein
MLAQPYSSPIDEINDIGDVSAASPSVGDVLQWTGAAWENCSELTTGKVIGTGDPNNYIDFDDDRQIFHAGGIDVFEIVETANIGTFCVNPDRLATVNFQVLDETAGTLILADTAAGTVTLANLTITSIAAGVADYDKFLVSDSGVVKYRTGAEILSDIGAAASGHNHDAAYAAIGHDHDADYADISHTHGIDDLTDVDTTGEEAPVKDEVLKWNGSQWVPALYNATFEFSVTDFQDGQAVTQLIGSGVWKAIGAITFTASYENGPPVSCIISIAGDFAGGSGWTDDEFDMSSSPTSKATTQPTNYPDDRGDAITFSILADGETFANQVVTFQNEIHWGSSPKNSGWSSAEILALNGSVIDSDHTRSGMSVTGLDAADYVVFACPSAYSNLTTVNFTYDGIVIPMTLVTSALSVTNSAGYVETYDVYASNIQQPSGGNKTLASDQSAALNYMFFGSDTGNPISEGQIENMDTKLTGSGFSSGKVANNTRARTVVSGAAGSGEYMWYCYPSRLGTVSVTIDGIPGGFESPIEVSVTNVNGYTETYYCYRSNYTDNVPKTYVFSNS